MSGTGPSRVWDKAKYHADGDWPDGLDPAQSFVHGGLYLGWCIERGLADPRFLAEVKDAADRLRRREITAPRFYAASCDGVLAGDMLTDEGNAFAAAYFDFDHGTFLEDYGQTLAEELPSIYHVEDTWGNYDRLRAVLDRRLAAWRAERTGAARPAATSPAPVSPKPAAAAPARAAAPAPRDEPPPFEPIDAVAARTRAPGWPADLARDAAAVPLGHYLAWCVERGLVNDAFRRSRAAQIDALRARRTTGPRLALLLGGALPHDWFTDEGRAFTVRYYASRLLDDVCAACGVASAFRADDTWAAYARIRDVLDRRLQQWRAKHGAAYAVAAPLAAAPIVASVPVAPVVTPPRSPRRRR